MSTIYWGVGLRRAHDEKTLDVLFPFIKASDSEEFAEIAKITGVNADAINSKVLSEEQLQALVEANSNDLSLANMLADFEMNDNIYSITDRVITVLPNFTDSSVESTEDAYLRLQMLSQRLVQPHGVSLDSIFGKLPNLAWTNYGPVFPEDVQELTIQTFASIQPLSVSHVDKFPYMANYTVPSGVRIGNGSKIRLGAYLGEGTTVMQAGFVNFNAGTEGNAMIEGRVSAGVFVSKDSDVGGGASIMGTLSGGGKQVVAIGSKCLLGANAGTGISLGFGCTVGAGTYVTASSKVSLYDENANPINLNGDLVAEGENVVKGLDLSGRDKLLIYTDSVSGKLICRPNPKTVELNSSLHLND
ncbi:DapH/DapD/GlmU-related protein [Lentisphaera marina]|uniref:DapH/DapD/GlmU-related protein n=1 Tax=Lentisphaera marina TaxID=1111041 RepID=UPI00236542B4|nr:DapH/DapD/GlmU-related protein [Lentisphaera marina]MDD7986394.1 DapH/DapD/GlmU-related protein [Lentisphaera marina]